MRRRVPSLYWPSCGLTARSLFAITALLAFSANAFAQPQFNRGVVPAAATAVETPVSIPSEPIAPAISGLLEKGSALETSGRWAEALSYYEQAIRQHPTDQILEGRFDVARLHYNFEQRLADRSYLESIRTLRATQARDLYADLLNKIEAHYYTTPPYQSDGPLHTTR